MRPRHTHLGQAGSRLTAWKQERRGRARGRALLLRAPQTPYRAHLALHERMVEMRRAAVDRLLHGSNQVSRRDGGTSGAASDLSQEARDHVEARRRRRSGA